MIIQSYTDDGRPPIDRLYQLYDLLETKYGWTKSLIYQIEDTPAYAYLTPQKGPSLWINAGVHGEEPPGPIALSRSIDKIGELGKTIPIVIMPLLNPVGYAKGWRYFNEYRDWHEGKSVSDSEHYLPDLSDPTKPRADKPNSEISAQVTRFVVDHLDDYPPILTIDHHEDEALPESYIYSQGPKGVSDPVAQRVVELIRQIVPLQLSGTTRFDEQVTNGVVADENGLPVKDGSIDELYAADKIYIDGRWVEKPSSKSSLVIETPTIGVSLEKRIEAHQTVIDHYLDLFQLANN